MFFPLFLQFAVWLLGSAGRFVNREISTGRLVNLFPQSTAASQSQLRILFLRDKKRGRTVELINSSYSSVLPTEVWTEVSDSCSPAVPKTDAPAMNTPPKLAQSTCWREGRRHVLMHALGATKSMGGSEIDWVEHQR